ncbi:MAG: helix-turn-helix domain-containing protein [Bacteroidetes bacterium]|nr:helix-turn-helix domain-containing protein [Bacteroidota bacterium]
MQLSLLESIDTAQTIPLNPQKIIDDLKLHNVYRHKQFYKPKEVASLLGISYVQVLYAITHYQMDAIRIGWIWRVPYNAIIRFMTERTYREELVEAYYDWIASRGIRD